MVQGSYAPSILSLHHFHAKHCWLSGCFVLYGIFVGALLTTICNDVEKTNFKLRKDSSRKILTKFYQNFERATYMILYTRMTRTFTIHAKMELLSMSINDLSDGDQLDSFECAFKPFRKY